MDRWADANTPDATTPRLRFVVQEMVRFRRAGEREWLVSKRSDSSR